MNIRCLVLTTTNTWYKGSKDLHQDPVLLTPFGFVFRSFSFLPISGNLSHVLSLETWGVIVRTSGCGYVERPTGRISSVVQTLTPWVDLRFIPHRNGEYLAYVQGHSLLSIRRVEITLFCPSIRSLGGPIGAQASPSPASETPGPPVGDEKSLISNPRRPSSPSVSVVFGPSRRTSGVKWTVQIPNPQFPLEN